MESGDGSAGGTVDQTARGTGLGGEMAVLGEAACAWLGDSPVDQNTDWDRELLLEAAQSAKDPLLLIDRSGLIRYANPAFEQLSGYRHEELVCRPVEEVDACGIGGPIDGEVLSELVGRRRWSGRVTDRRADGSSYQVECVVAPVFSASGELHGYVLVKRDITEQLRFEAAAEAMANMESIGAAFAGIRHQIGNPVNSTKNLLRLLQENLEDFSSDKVRGYLARAEEKMGQVEYLLNSLKSFNVFDLPEVRRIDLVAFMERFIDLAGADLQQRGIALEFQAPEAPVVCQADPRALQQALLNLVANAADALDGRIGPTILLRLRPAGAVVQVEVEDNGVGMTARGQEYLFRPFYTTKPDGSGLGLIIVKKLLASMRGTIEVSSRIGRGTRVLLSLPRE